MVHWMMKSAVLAAALSCVFSAAAPVARACGGLFCSSTPVDQSAERIVFKVREDDRTDMIVQLRYQGKAEDFAWLLPLAEPPSKADLATFPQAALDVLDQQTSAIVTSDCVDLEPHDSLSAQNAATGAPGVDVYVRAQVGNFEVAVIGSSDARASFEWLEQNGFRVSEAMLGFIQLYTAEGMKFLALKLLPDKDVSDITPFKITLPGSTPSIPLRLSAVAAEPEMGIVVFILGNQRYEPANARELSIDDRDLRLDSGSWGSAVARAVDAVQGRGFVVEDAELVAPLRTAAANSFTSSDAQRDARQALLDLYAGSRYLTRLYTRLSPEEMTFDPIFKRSNKGDVSRFHTYPLSYYAVCQLPPAPDPCAAVACGAMGLCRTFERDGQKLTGCACADGSTARPTAAIAPTFGTPTVTVSCVDKRLSFLNPGDRNAADEALPDPCVGFDCGGHGTCVPMNMTPTCECEHGYVAEAFLEDGTNRSVRCVKPQESVPAAFYNRRPAARDEALPIGREVTLSPATGPSDADDPVKTKDESTSTERTSAHCSVGPERAQTSHAALMLLLSLLAGALSYGRAKRRREAAVRVRRSARPPN